MEKGSEMPSKAATIHEIQPAYDTKLAFSRTIGFVTHEELETLQRSRVAIAGLGGVGGHHLETLTRLGIGHFNIADFDHFEIHNINRQIGAKVSTFGRPKCEVMAEVARDINPGAVIREFPQGVNKDNLDAFLEGVDVYIDGLDFFAFSAREMMLNACAERGIPAVTVGPIGMGAAMLVFMPGQMTFEQYVGWAGKSEEEKGLRLLLGLTPKGSHRQYLVDPTAVDLANRKGPSTPMACNLCAGVAGCETLKILLKRGPIKAVPHSVVYDAYLNRTIHSYTPGGMKNPLMRLKLMVLRRFLKKSNLPPPTK